MTAPDLTPAPHELAHLAHTTAGADPVQLGNTLLGYLQASVPWRELLRMTHLWIQTSPDADIRDLRTAIETWQRSHPQGART
jgi:hypothetical protein